MDAWTELDGKAYMEAVLAGRVPLAPLVQLLGMQLDAVDDGRVVFSLEPSPNLYNGVGIVHGGVAATLLDTAIGCAITTLVPAGKVAVTVDLQVRYFRPISVSTGRVRCEGTVVNRGRTTIAGEGRVVDANGKLYANATSGYAVVDHLQRQR